ncbi:glycogen debranching protein GlgX [Desulfogranum japonicum]|uniref:glycogen debranching protein GlgX n=1 Tax=Desulfogranum japonicum TaxID=231447 RepID=UPI00040B2ACE|nr:glycogen debranching protein GlgX [Desulfogranum japonicum]
MKQHYVVHTGTPLPLGSSITPNGVNFALFSRHAKSVTLVLETDEKGKTELQQIPLDPVRNKTGDIWHVCMPDVPLPLYYGYILDGPWDPGGNGHAYDKTRILLDPYAKELRPAQWGTRRDCFGKRPCCHLRVDPYDWEGDLHPKTELKDSIIYEMHVRGFTRHQSAGVSHPGTFRGIMEKTEYLQSLGITAIELMPVTEFNENESLFVNPKTGNPLKNYWGYNPVSFFAPKSGYCSEPTDALNEFRDMVKHLHKAGIEVFLDIVYNHTGEGGIEGPTTSFRGIDNTIYYLLDPWTRAYLNFSGCGNTCNCNHPIVRNLIIDALRWWVVEMHVDGFRFDLASILGRDSNGHVLPNPPMVEAIAEDPVLSDAKIIAEAWDAAGLYQVGSFSTHHRWAEWNGRFRDDVRMFMCSTQGSIPALATRIAGSSDLYQHNGRRPCNSINFITSHDGFTLHDLVSYNQKHNLENGEDNRDGDNHNISWNSGKEGKTISKSILEMRSRRIRSFLTILFISQGVPMLVAGDEFGRTQKGNNNAWCQDNTTSWINWNLLLKNAHLFTFVQYLITLRKQHEVFRRDDFFATANHEEEPLHMQEISWHSLVPGEQDWSPECLTLAFLLTGSHFPEPDDDFYVMLNGEREKEKTFLIPAPPVRQQQRIWKKIIDTCQTGADDALPPDQAQPVTAGKKISILPMGCIVLQSSPLAQKKTTCSGKRR